MADAGVQQPPRKTEKKIGSTVYVVTSHFQDQGSTAVDKIRCLIDVSTKQKKLCRKS